MNDLLIVGAGPTGLMLAVWLAANGIKARVVDPKAGPIPETRAVGIQARTLEFWDMLGIADRAIERGRKTGGVDLWVDGRRVAGLRLEDIGRGLSPYPFLFLLGQTDTERLLYERLKELGGEVEWGVRVDAIEGNNVTLGDERVAYRFILGCDGANSIVRHSAGLQFEGGTYDAHFYVADVDATQGVVQGDLNVALFRDRFLAFFPLRDENRYRMVGLLTPEIDPQAVTVDDVRPEVERLMRTKLDHVRWFSVYRVHHRVVDHFRRGPLFLLGDAAHIHSPVGAQGMNTGLGDAVNLAWKLAEVLKHGADERLLDTYEAERLPFARSLVATTDRAFELVVRQTSLARFVRLRVVPRLLPILVSVPAIRRFVFRRISQILIDYRGGQLTLGKVNGYVAGDRLPPREGAPARPDRWRLLFSGGSPEGAADWCQDNGVELTVESGPAAVLLVRPDGHIGAALPSFSPDTLDTYLRDRIGRPVKS